MSDTERVYLGGLFMLILALAFWPDDAPHPMTFLAAIEASTTGADCCHE